jgi:hypothetical protein
MMLARHRPARLLLLFAAFLLFAFASGCSRKSKILNPAQSGQVGWNNTIFGLMRDRSSGTTTLGCMGCHNPGAGNITDFTDYFNVAADTNNIQVKLGASGNMKVYLKDQTEVQTILDWISNGCPR